VPRLSEAAALVARARARATDIAGDNLSSEWNGGDDERRGEQMGGEGRGVEAERGKRDGELPVSAGEGRGRGTDRSRVGKLAGDSEKSRFRWCGVAPTPASRG